MILEVHVTTEDDFVHQSNMPANFLDADVSPTSHGAEPNQ